LGGRSSKGGSKSFVHHIRSAAGDAERQRNQPKGGTNDVDKVGKINTRVNGSKRSLNLRV